MRSLFLVWYTGLASAQEQHAKAMPRSKGLPSRRSPLLSFHSLLHVRVILSLKCCVVESLRAVLKLEY
jgi:hypothetical protein